MTQVLLLLVSTVLAAGAAAATPVPDPFETPAPQFTATPVPQPEEPGTGEGLPEPGVVAQILEVVFSAETLSEALAQAFEDAAGRERAHLAEQTGQLGILLAEVIQPPQDGHFAAIAASGFATAGALAPALFIVRLALHHWREMLGERDGLLRVIGDWLAAGFLAAAAGPFLDLLVETGWWAAGSAIGETGALATAFFDAFTVSEAAKSILVPGKPSMFGAIFVIGGGLGGLLGAAGMAFAFAVAQSVLFVLASAAPFIAVASVVPHLVWLRALWLKAAVVLALLPIAAASLFKAGIALSGFFGGGGLAGLLIRLCWLWGAAGFMLSLAGVLGKVTLSTAVDSAAKAGAGMKVLVATALVGSGGTGSVGGAAAGLFGVRDRPDPPGLFPGSGGGVGAPPGDGSGAAALPPRFPGETARPAEGSSSVGAGPSMPRGGVWDHRGMRVGEEEGEAYEESPVPPPWLPGGKEGR